MIAAPSERYGAAALECEELDTLSPAIPSPVLPRTAGPRWVLRSKAAPLRQPDQLPVLGHPKSMGVWQKEEEREARREAGNKWGREGGRTREMKG